MHKVEIVNSSEILNYGFKTIVSGESFRVLNFKSAKIELFNYIELYQITCEQIYDKHLQDDHLRNIQKLVAPSILQRIKQTAFKQVSLGNIQITYIDRIQRNEHILPVIKGIILALLISIANENKLPVEEFCYVIS